MLKAAIAHLKRPLLLSYGTRGVEPPANGGKGAEPADHDEYQYLALIRDIGIEGVYETGRNGIAKTVFGSAMHFSLADGTMPILTTKAVAWRTCFKELMWFINGSTDNAILQHQGVNIWNGNATREFLDSQGLSELHENDLGPVYGHQWRHFNAPYTSCHTDYSGQGVDQLASIIKNLRDPATRGSRRLILSAWNPCQLQQMALPPCHLMAQFHVTEGRYLSCSLYQRSGDVGLGVPFNIASYSFLTHLLAHHCGLEAKEFLYYLGNCHIYDDHEAVLQQQLVRQPFPFPHVRFTTHHPKIEAYSLADVDLTNYQCHPSLKMEMRP